MSKKKRIRARHAIPRFLSLALVCGIASAPVAAQTTRAGTDPRLQIANLTQDVHRLNRELGQLRIEVERLQRENQVLEQKLVDKSTLESRLTQLTLSVNSSLATLQKELLAADERQKDAIVKEVARQIGELARQTQETVDALGKYVGFRGSAVPTTRFSDDYPKNGIAYEVQPGDTLSSIAKEFGSSVRDIQNANRIANPQSLQAGETIFVPQGN